MQLTRFDRWLREKFVYETHIQTLRPPESVPAGIRIVELPDAPGKRFKHLFVARNSRGQDTSPTCGNSCSSSWWASSTVRS